MDDEGIIEIIARRWFTHASNPPLNEALWGAQPLSVREVFMERARRFWDKPDACHFEHRLLVDKLAHTATDARRKLENAL